MTESPLPPFPEYPRPAEGPRRRRPVARSLAALGAVGLVGGVVLGVTTARGSTSVVGQASPAPGEPVSHLLPEHGWSGRDWSGGIWSGGEWSGGPWSGGSIPGGSSSPGGSYPGGSTPGSPGSSGSSAGSASTGTAATAAESVGIVDITTVLGYQSSAAAGTGMVLTSNGEVLTNNHVVDGATSIRVTVVSTGRSYRASVVGTDPTADVAVLRLSGASGLQTARLGSAAATVGEAVTGVGNAGGTGSLTAAAGAVTALDRSITASDQNGSNPEQLSGMIETNAGIQPGDSGGPLFDTATGRVIGMDTAASSGGAAQGFAIPITTAQAIARQIESGVDNATIHQGLPAFLGVSVQNGTAGAMVGGVVPGGPAAQAGITAGDVITGVGGTSIGSAGDLSSALAGYTPGDRVRVSWTATDGTAQSATVTLATGPAN